MFLERFALVVIAVLSGIGTRSVQAFSVGSRSCLSRVPSGATWLRAEVPGEGEAVEEPQEGEPKSADAAAADILNSPAFLTRKLDVIKSDIAKVEGDLAVAKERSEAGRAEWGTRFDDLRKEYENIQDRMKTQNKEGDVMATVQVTRSMLDFLDNYDRALQAVTPETDVEQAIETDYKQAYQMVLDTLERLGVETVPTVGTEFDYEFHQAVMQKPSDYDEGIVCEELQKGFKIGDTLVRAAMVAVAA